MKTLTSYGRLTFLVIGIALAGVITFFASAHLPHAQAAELPPPSKFLQADADALYHVLDGLDKNVEAAKKLNADTKAKLERRDEIWRKYGITLAMVREGKVGWSFDTLEIQRAPAMTAQLAPASPQDERKLQDAGPASRPAPAGGRAK